MPTISPDDQGKEQELWEKTTEDIITLNCITYSASAVQDSKKERKVKQSMDKELDHGDWLECSKQDENWSRDAKSNDERRLWN